MYLCTIITNWMDTRMVLAENFPTKYSSAIYSQYAIDWDNFFCGNISQEWLLIYIMNLGKIEMTYKKILLSISGVPILSKSNSLIITAHGKTDSEQQ